MQGEGRGSLGGGFLERIRTQNLAQFDPNQEPKSTQIIEIHGVMWRGGAWRAKARSTREVY